MPCIFMAKKSGCAGTTLTFCEIHGEVFGRVMLACALPVNSQSRDDHALQMAERASDAAWLAFADGQPQSWIIHNALCAAQETAFKRSPKYETDEHTGVAYIFGQVSTAESLRKTCSSDAITDPKSARDLISIARTKTHKQKVY
jgi:hypothetical protein